MNLAIETTSKCPLVSVIMPTFNGADFIHEAIQSILDQSYTNLELIIVDDGSTDKTSQIISAFKDSRIIYFKKEFNTGIADSLNLGILKAKGQYVARMDDDDVSVKDRLYKQVEYLETHKDVIVCATNDQNLGGQKPYLTDLDIRIGLLFRNVIIHASVMMPKSLFESCKYDISMVPSEDYDLWSRILKKGKFHKLQEPLMTIRYSFDGQTATRRNEQLHLNVTINKRIRDYYGFNLNTNEEFLLAYFLEKNYTISGNTLSKVLKTIDKLKDINKRLKVFPEYPFDSEVEFHKENFLIKYFSNRKLIKKINPFIWIPMQHKLQIVEYYFKKII